MFVPKIGGSILSQAPRNLILVIVDGPKKGERVVLRPGEVCVVGRTSAANLACEDQYMSSKHFEVVNRIEDFSIRDLNSRNGTKIKDEAISELALTNPSTVKAGTSTFEVAWENSPEEWGTQIGSSVSLKRSGSMSSGIAAMPMRNSSSVFSTAPGENSQHSSYISSEHEFSKAERSQDLVLESLLRKVQRHVPNAVTRPVSFGTDASSLAQIGIPSLVFGPGGIEQAHTKDEWVEIEQLNQAVSILFDCVAGIGHR